jgi:hypothetical protein
LVQQAPEDIGTPVTGQGSVLPTVGNEGFFADEAGNDGSGITATGGGLKPPNPNSVDPNGIPPRPAADREPIRPGVEADAAACDADPSVVAAQLPEVMPEVPEVLPEGLCGVEPPMPEQAVRLPIVDPSGDVPDITGLRPGEPSSVAPNGIPVGPTAAPGPMPSGEVTPSGATGTPIPPTWAMAQPPLMSVAAAVAIHKRFISSLRGLRPRADQVAP